MKPTRKQVEAEVTACRRISEQRRVGRYAVIVALADERDQAIATLDATTESHRNVSAQCDELAALLTRYVRNDREPALDEEADALLAKYKATGGGT